MLGATRYGGRLGRILVGFFACAPVLLAHEIPARVRILAFIKPQKSVLHVVLRAPLGAMRDMDFPLKGAGYLDVARASQQLRSAAQLWLLDYLQVYENGRQLNEGRVVAVQASLPTDRSFGTYDEAVAHIHGPPLDSLVEIPWQQATLDVVLEYSIARESSSFAVDPRFAQLGIQTSTTIRFVAPTSAERAFTFVGDPGRVQLDPEWWHAFGRFVSLGFFHILEGIDHLLFLLCLVIPVRRLGSLVAIVTAFTAAHSVTLIASAFGFAPSGLWFPPFIEVLIALSIVFMAIENMVGVREERRWKLAFGFGLVHGFGFSFALRDSLQFGGAHLVTSLVAFNIGVEIGQLLVVAVSLPVMVWIVRRLVSERIALVVLSVMVAHTSWHWLTERVSILREYAFSAPAVDRALAVNTMRFGMLFLVVVAVWYAMRTFVARLGPNRATAHDGGPK